MIRTDLIKPYFIARNLSYFLLLDSSRTSDSIMNITKYIFENNPVNNNQNKCKKRHKESFISECNKAWELGDHNFIMTFKNFMLRKYNMRISNVDFLKDRGVLMVRFCIIPSVKIHNNAAY